MIQESLIITTTVILETRNQIVLNVVMAILKAGLNSNQRTTSPFDLMTASELNLLILEIGSIQDLESTIVALIPSVLHIVKDLTELTHAKHVNQETSEIQEIQENHVVSQETSEIQEIIQGIQEITTAQTIE